LPLCDLLTHPSRLRGTFSGFCFVAPRQKKAASSWLPVLGFSPFPSTSAGTRETPFSQIFNGLLGIRLLFGPSTVGAPQLTGVSGLSYFFNKLAHFVELWVKSFFFPETTFYPPEDFFCLLHSHFDPLSVGCISSSAAKHLKTVEYSSARISGLCPEGWIP